MAILIDPRDAAHRPKSLGLSLAHVAPTVSPIKALDDPALLNRTIDHFRIFWMNGDPLDVRNMGWWRIAPLISSGEFAHPTEFHPSLSSIAASKKERRLGPRIDGHGIGRVKR